MSTDVDNSPLLHQSIFPSFVCEQSFWNMGAWTFSQTLSSPSVFHECSQIWLINCKSWPGNAASHLPWAYWARNTTFSSLRMGGDTIAVGWLLFTQFAWLRRKTSACCQNVKLHRDECANPGSRKKLPPPHLYAQAAKNKSTPTLPKESLPPTQSVHISEHPATG